MLKNFLPAVLLLLFLCAPVRAADEQRWLFVFDTSAAMKKRLPAVEAEIKSLLLSSIDGKLKTNDSLGVWTFDSQLHTGQFPLLWWQSERAGLAATNLVTFLRGQKFFGDPKLDVLQPTLDRVIADSERLTVVIFCDGANAINGTPYDDSLNGALAQTSAERKKSKQPVIILLRTQMGKYVGAMLNFPPQPLSAPPFPLLPREIKIIPSNPPPVVVVAPAPPKSVAPSLIIVGTHVSSDTNDIAKHFAAANSPGVTNNPGAVMVKTNASVSAPKPLMATVTNPPTPLAQIAAVSAETNSVATPTTPAGSFDKVLIYAGALLLLAAVGLVIFLLGRRRAPRSSLITSSMQDDFEPPRRK